MKAIFGFLIVLAMAPAAHAQTNISGALQCAKPEDQHAIPVGDRPNHSLAVEQFKCTWTKPLEIAGIKLGDGVSTAIDDISGNVGHSRGYHVSTMANGDHFHVRYQGAATYKSGAVESLKGTWSFAGGTGKLMGLKGQGSYKCSAAGENINCDIEGAYQLPK